MTTIILKKKPSHNLSGSARVLWYTVLYIGVFNFSYTVFLCLKLGVKYYAFLEFWYRVY